MEGFYSLEEAVQEYIGAFAALQRAGGENSGDAAADKAFLERKSLLEERERLSELFLPWRYLEECCALTEAEYWLVMYAFCWEAEEGLYMDCGGGFGKPPSLQYALHLLSLALPVSFALVAELCSERGRLGCLLQPCPEDAEEEAGRGLLSGPLLLNRTAFYFLLTGELPTRGLLREEWYELSLAGDRQELYGGELLPLHMREYDRLQGYLGGAARRGTGTPYSSKCRSCGKKAGAARVLGGRSFT